MRRTIYEDKDDDCRPIIEVQWDGEMIRDAVKAGTLTRKEVATFLTKAVREIVSAFQEPI